MSASLVELEHQPWCITFSSSDRMQSSVFPAHAGILGRGTGHRSADRPRRSGCGRSFLDRGAASPRRPPRLGRLPRNRFHAKCRNDRTTNLGHTTRFALVLCDMSQRRHERRQQHDASSVVGLRPGINERLRYDWWSSSPNGLDGFPTISTQVLIRSPLRSPRKKSYSFFSVSAGADEDGP